MKVDDGRESGGGVFYVCYGECSLRFFFVGIVMLMVLYCIKRCSMVM